MRLTVSTESDSKIIWCSPRSQASSRPVIAAQNSARTEEQIPVLIAKPLIHDPMLSLINPPAPAHPGFPLLQLSTFNFTHSIDGYRHIATQSQTSVYALMVLHAPPHHLIVCIIAPPEPLWPPNTLWFRPFHRCRATIPNTKSQNHPSFVTSRLERLLMNCASKNTLRFCCWTSY